MVEKLDFTKLSHSAWKLLQSLGAATPVTYQSPQVTPDSIASALVTNSKVLVVKAVRHKELRQINSACQTSSPFSISFTLAEVDKGLQATKSGKV